MSQQGDLQEMYRRIHHALEGHPYLSGLMTDELQSHLKDLASSHLERAHIPEHLTPHTRDLGYDVIPDEEDPYFQEWHRRHRIPVEESPNEPV